MPERGLDHGEATVGGLLQRWGMRQEGGGRGAIGFGGEKKEVSICS